MNGKPMTDKEKADRWLNRGARIEPTVRFTEIFCVFCGAQLWVPCKSSCEGMRAAIKLGLIIDNTRGK